MNLFLINKDISHSHQLLLKPSTWLKISAWKWSLMCARCMEGQCYKSELWSIFWGLKIAIDHGLFHLTLETDSKLSYYMATSYSSLFCLDFEDYKILKLFCFVNFFFFAYIKQNCWKISKIWFVFRFGALSFNDLATYHCNPSYVGR
jgi:hypothetical protein